MIKRTPIKKKRCKCSPDCKLYPTLGFSGYNFKHAPEEIKEREGDKKTRQIKKANANKAISAKLRQANRASEESVALDLFFKLCRTKMTGRCIEEGCCNSTNKNDDKYYRWSICHIVPKSLVFSVASNPYNWIELCQQHHQEFDSTFERASKMKCFITAKRMFILFEHLIPPEELRKVNPFLMKP